MSSQKGWWYKSLNFSAASDKFRETSEKFREGRDKVREVWEREKKKTEKQAEEREDTKRRQEQAFWEEEARRQREEEVKRAQEEASRKRNQRPNSYRKPDQEDDAGRSAAGNAATGTPGDSGPRRAGKTPGPAPPARAPASGRAGHLQLLGFGPAAEPSEEDLRKAYRTMAMRWHPDRPHNRERPAEATQKFQQAKDAYEYFMEEHRRKRR